MGKYKKLCLCLVTIISLFLFTENVFASVSISGSSLGSSGFAVLTPGNETIRFSDDIVYGQYGNGEFPPSYYLITFCTDSQNITSWYDNDGKLPTINFYNTNFNCMFPNSTYTGGHIVYLYGQITPTWSTSGTSATLNGNLTFYEPNQSSWALLSLQTSNEEISIDYASGSIISQNATLIDQNTQMIAGQNSIYAQIRDTQAQTQQKLDSVNTSINETNDTLKDNNSDEATNEAGSFFSGFETDTFGLTSIVTAPLNLIESITSSTCVPMGLPIPFIEGQTLNLPCLRGIYEDNFGTFYDIYKTITFGIVAYYICVKLFNLVKDFKNPEHDEIEVLEL